MQGGDLDRMDALMALLDRQGPPVGEYGISLTRCPWPIPEQPILSRREMLGHRVGPTGGSLTASKEIDKRRATQKAQRIARRRNRP